jgi:2'-5' RNA ligase
VTASARFAALQRNRFRALGRTEPAIVTAWPAAWTPDRRLLLFLAEVGQHEAVRTAAARALAPIAGPGVPPLDARSLHVTVQAIGYLDALPEGAQRTTLLDARSALEGCGTVELTIVGAGSFAEAAVLWLDPWEPLSGIRDTLFEGVSTLAPARPERTRSPEEGGFAPHISIAYYDGAVDTRPIADAFEAIELSGRFTIDAIRLVSVPRPIGAQVHWNVLGTFPLGGRVDDPHL